MVKTKTPNENKKGSSGEPELPSKIKTKNI
jgi:hypothetical protein